MRWIYAGGVAALAVALVMLLLASTEDKAGPGGDSADRLIFWVDDCNDVATLTDSELDAWKAKGVDGFVCMGDRLQGMGGTQDYTPDRNADLSGANYELQRSLRDSGIVERAAERGMKLYLGVKLANYDNTSTPLADWFDDPGWSQQVLPKMRDLAGAAKLLGFAGIAFDQELYPQQGGAQTATWAWNYPGNTHSEAAVRAMATQRGGELMSAILDAFPGAEFAVYSAFFPGDWNDLVQAKVNDLKDSSSARLDIDFWDGMTGVEGYGAIRFYDSIFYKSPHRGTWDNALAYNANSVFATLSRRFSNWDYASSRVYLSPFSWIDAGPSPGSFDDARPPADVAEQLLAFRKWGMGGEFANFVYGGRRGFDYSPYVSAMQAASAPDSVDGVDPTLQVTSGPGGSAPPASIEGTAHDNLAIRAVRWRDDRGGSGVARLTWKILSGDFRSGYVWETHWSFPAAELSPGAAHLTITAEDIKGNTSSPAVYRTS